MSIDIHAPAFAARLAGTFLAYKRAEAAYAKAAEAAILDQSNAMTARRLVVALQKFGEAEREWLKVVEVAETGAQLDVELSNANG